MRILVLGASGMAGHVMARYLSEEFHYATIITHVRKNKFDDESIVADLYNNQTKILNTDEVDRVLEIANPDICINCVGVLVKASEEDPDMAWALNSALPHYLASKCRVIQISTDCVFSGKDFRAPYTESSPTTAQDVYGRSKAGGELHKHENGLTIRTSIIGPEIKKESTGLFDWFMGQSGYARGWTNALWNGVTTLELARFVGAYAIGMDALDSTGKGYMKGTVHLHSEEVISKFELLKIINEVYQRGVTVVRQRLDESVNKSLKSTNKRMNFVYNRKPIRRLVEEQNGWYQEKQA